MTAKSKPLKGKYGMLVERVPRKKSIDEIVQIARESISPEVTVYYEGVADGMAIVLNDVKSAVQGLLNELQDIANKEEDVILDKSYTIHRIVVQKIKKWLYDVVVEDG